MIGSLSLDAKVWKAGKALLRRRFVRFLVVGAVNTAFSYGVYALLLFVGCSYPVASLIALIAGILFSFKTQERFVFDRSDRKALLRFVVAWTFIYFANIGFIKGMLLLGLDAYTAGALAILPIAVLSYAVQRSFVFRPRDQR